MILTIAIVAICLIAALFAIALPLVSLVSVRRQRRGPSGPMTGPLVTLIVPCKGTDHELAENLEAIADQEYEPFEVRFVTESDDDPAVATIEAVIEGNNRASHVVAGLASRGSQKNHNLLAGVATADGDVLAFCDSDVRPAGRWLRELIAPLADDGVTVTTGYRWLVPRRPSAAHRTHTVISAYLLMLAGLPSIPSVWGGSVAIRRRDFASLKVESLWRRSLSDDLSLQKLLSDRHLVCRFVPACVSPAYDTFDRFATLIEWFSRQVYYLKLHDRPMWRVSFAIETLFGITAIAAPVLVGVGILRGVPVLVGAAASLLVALTLAGWLIKLPYRQFPDFRPATWIALIPVARIVGMIALWRSAIMRRVIWRGITYEFNRDGTVKRVHHGPEGT